MMTSNDHISPIKCALKFKPPLMVIVYDDLNSGKTRSRTIPLRGFSRTNDVRAYANQLLDNPRHSGYVSKLPRQQLDSLLQKIKDSHNGVTPSPIHSSLLGIPPLTSPSRQDDVKQLNLEFDAALAEMLGTDDDDDDEANISTTKQSTPKESPDQQLPTSLISSDNGNVLLSPTTRLPPVSKLPPLNYSSSLTTNDQTLFKDKTDLVSTNHPPSLPTSHQSTIDSWETKEPWLSSVSHPRMEERFDKNEPEVPDYSADFNSESEKLASALTQSEKHAGFRGLDDDHSLSFAVEELDEDDGSLCFSEDEGANFAGDKLLASSSGEDFRALNIFTPPPQVEDHHPVLETAGNLLPNGHSKRESEEDLNKVDDEYLASKKAEMDAQFNANQLKPGDEGYIYDKEIEFDNGPRIESGWDSDGNDSYSDF